MHILRDDIRILHAVPGADRDHAFARYFLMPPTGLPLGNIQNLLQYHNAYTDLRSMSYPPDAQTAGSHALYDRWCDSWNVQTEAVIIEQGRGLGAVAFLMARGNLKNQSWSSAGATIGGAVAYIYSSSGGSLGTQTTSDTGQELLAFYDLTNTPTNGGDITVQWASTTAGGFFKFGSTS